MMNNKIIAMILLLVICLGFSVPACAAMPDRLVDDADLLTASEEQLLTEKLNAVSDKYEVDVVIVTTQSVGNMSLERYSERYGVGNGKDAVVLLVAMESRDVAITTSGICKQAIGENERDDILDTVSGNLTIGEYADAFEDYITECDHYIDIEINGVPYQSVVLKYLGISLAVGLITALIATGIMASKLRSVRPKVGASDYVKAGSLNVTLSRDMFLYRRVDRRAKPKQSSGGSHGSSGNGHSSRKF